MKHEMVLAALKKTTILGILFLLPTLARAQKADSPAITELLKEAKSHAVLAEEDADKLMSYTLSDVAWQSHAQGLNQMKKHANDLIHDFNSLSALRSEASPWQQEAIDRVNPLLQGMSNHLTTTINHLNENQGRVHMAAYRDYVKANRDLMNKASRLISDFVEYGEAMAKSDDLEKTLDLSATAREEE